MRLYLNFFGCLVVISSFCFVGNMDTTEAIILLELQKSITLQSTLLDIATAEPMHHKYSKLNLDIYTDDECLFEFRFHKSDLKMLVYLKYKNYTLLIR